MSEAIVMHSSPTSLAPSKLILYFTRASRCWSSRSLISESSPGSCIAFIYSSSNLCCIYLISFRSESKFFLCFWILFLISSPASLLLFSIKFIVSISICLRKFCAWPYSYGFFLPRSLMFSGLSRNYLSIASESSKSCS